jgi:hypothetical protein
VLGCTARDDDDSDDDDDDNNNKYKQYRAWGSVVVKALSY